MFLGSGGLWEPLALADVDRPAKIEWWPKLYLILLLLLLLRADVLVMAIQVATWPSVDALIHLHAISGTVAQDDILCLWLSQVGAPQSSDCTGHREISNTVGQCSIFPRGV